MSHLGVSIFSALSSDDGLNLAHKILPNAIILDVQMPSMDGLEVLKALKSNSLTSEIPILLLTINDEHHEGYEIGANDYLFKPIDRDRLISVVAKYRHRDNSQLSILIIEDDVNVRSMLRRMLEKENCLVTEAQDGEEALEIMSEQVPQLILLDLMMPNIDGFEFIHLLRLRQDMFSIPILIITAKDLNDQDYVRLSGSVQKILQKTNFSYVQLMEEIVQKLYKSGALPISGHKT